MFNAMGFWYSWVTHKCYKSYFIRTYTRIVSTTHDPACFCSITEYEFGSRYFKLNFFEFLTARLFTSS